MAHKSFKDKITDIYVRRIKKWMFCPNCQVGKLKINKALTLWKCEECGYELPADEYKDDYIFWWCDECNAYLNIQEGFNRKSSKHICKQCGYENDTTFANVVGICSDCGKHLSDKEATLCDECKLIRKRKAIDWSIKAGKFTIKAVLLAFAAVATTKTIQALNSDDSDPDNLYYSTKWLENATDDQLDEEREKVRVAYVNSGLTNMSDSEVDRLYFLLKKFDNEKSERAWEGKEYSYPVHREHGWYLPDDD